MGSDYIARHHIWKEPLGVRNRTMAEPCPQDDRRRLQSVQRASADYLLVFRKRGDNPFGSHHPGAADRADAGGQIRAELPYRNWTGKRTEQVLALDMETVRRILGRRADRPVPPFRESRTKTTKNAPARLDVIIERCNCGRTLVGADAVHGRWVWRGLRSGGDEQVRRWHRTKAVVLPTGMNLRVPLDDEQVEDIAYSKMHRHDLAPPLPLCADSDLEPAAWTDRADDTCSGAAATPTAPPWTPAAAAPCEGRLPGHGDAV